MVAELNWSLRKGVALAIVAVLAAISLCLTGCGANYKFGNLKAEYQKAELPTHFNSGNRRARMISAAFSVNNQEPLSSSGTYHFRGDTTGRILAGHPSNENYRHEREIEERMEFLRDEAGVQLSYLRQRSWFFHGLSAGTSLPHVALYNLGVFAGISRRIGMVTPSICAGLHRSAIKASSRYWVNSPSHTDLETIYVLDSSKALKYDYGFSAKFGFLLDAGSGTFPYFTMGISNHEMWQAIDDPERFDIGVSEYGMGIKRQIGGKMHVQVEANYASLSLRESYRSYHFNSKVFLTREF